MNGCIYRNKQVDFDTVIGTAKFHHESWAKGYISRKLECIIEPYAGRFGKGFKVFYPCYRSTWFCRVYYYIEET